MKNQKTFVLDLSNNFFRNPYLNIFVKSLIGVALYYVIIINANIVTFTGRFDIVLFAITHILIETILIRYVYRYLTKYIIMSFGVVLILPITVAASIAYFVNQPYVMFPNTESFLGFVVIFMTSRKIVSILIQRYIKRKKYEKLLTERVSKDV